MTDNCKCVNHRGFTAHLNIRSLKPKINDLVILISEIRPSILTISESWFTPSIQDTVVALEGYDMHRSDHSPNSHACRVRGGGLITYLHKPCTADADRYADLNRNCSDTVSQILSVKMLNSKSMVILNIYRPPSGNLDLELSIIPDRCPPKDIT